LLDEMRQVSRRHYTVSPEQVLRMGTLDGAEALDRHHDVGGITLGKTANLVAVPIPSGTNGSPDDVLTAILADESAPSAVYLAGRRL
jgi:aminodeoxyfutalosine deaminase